MEALITAAVEVQQLYFTTVLYNTTVSEVSALFDDVLLICVKRAEVSLYQAKEVNHVAPANRLRACHRHLYIHSSIQGVHLLGLTESVRGRRGTARYEGPAE